MVSTCTAQALHHCFTQSHLISVTTFVCNAAILAQIQQMRVPLSVFLLEKWQYCHVCVLWYHHNVSQQEVGVLLQESSGRVFGKAFSTAVIDSIPIKLKRSIFISNTTAHRAYCIVSSLIWFYSNKLAPFIRFKNLFGKSFSSFCNLP